jgi:ABC-type glycerol-3-phosphate transport system permease component
MRVVFVLVFVVLLTPLWFEFVGSLQDMYGIMVMPPAIIPPNPTLDNYLAIAKWPIPRFAINTVFVATGTVILSVITSCAAGYVFAFYDFPVKRVLWMAFLFGIMVPRISLLIPQYVILNRIGLAGELWGVILPYVFVPTSVYLARTYFETVPRSLLESARIDGANEWQVLTRVVMPVSRPIVTALSVFAAIFSLTDYIWQMLVLQVTEKQTLIVGMIRRVMHHFAGEEMVNPIGKSFAVGMILFVPLLAIFLFSNKYFTGAISGAIKE